MIIDNTFRQGVSHELQMKLGIVGIGCCPLPSFHKSPAAFMDGRGQGHSQEFAKWGKRGGVEDRSPPAGSRGRAP